VEQKEGKPLSAQANEAIPTMVGCVAQEDDD